KIVHFFSIRALSAGSIVMGPSIEYLQYLYPEDNQFNDTDLTGLNLTSTTIFPHFKEMLTRDADIDKKLTSYENTTGVKIMRLNNDQALSCHCKDKVLID
uniref:Type 1 glutamine amidotransferase-like domain-containing protein n=1 Tax=Leuconostoc mesenteroides TaxID=1245 RepID=UPI002360351B